jgi:hypothetical protein
MRTLREVRPPRGSAAPDGGGTGLVRDHSGFRYGTFYGPVIGKQAVRRAEDLQARSAAGCPARTRRAPGSGAPTRFTPQTH